METSEERRNLYVKSHTYFSVAAGSYSTGEMRKLMEKQRTQQNM